MVFPAVMNGCESWTIKKAEHWRMDAFELWCWRKLESPLNCKEIQPVHSKGDQSWVFIGKTDVEAETPILWPPDAKSWLIGKDPDAGKDWGQEEKGMTEDEMVGWHHWLDEHGFGWTPGVGDGQGGLVCCSSWSHKSRTRLSDWTELTWTGWYIPIQYVKLRTDLKSPNSMPLLPPLCILVLCNRISELKWKMGLQNLKKNRSMGSKVNLLRV